MTSFTMERLVVPVGEHTWESGVRFARRGRLLQGSERKFDKQMPRVYYQ